MTLENYLQKHYSSTSVNGYKNMINRFKTSLGEKAERATYTDIVDYIGVLRKQELHPKSLRNHLFALKIYFRYLIIIKKRADHPCRYLHLKDQINRQITIENLYGKTVLETLYENHKASNPKNQRRDKVIISLLIYQALTVLEIRNLKLSNVDIEKGIIKIKESRQNRGRMLNLKSSQILLFHEYLKMDRKKYFSQENIENQKDYFILNQNGLPIWAGSINRLINRDRKKLDRLSPKKIRQSVITHLLKEKNDVRIVQTFAGHRRTASTEAYQQTGLEKLKSAIENKHPLQ